MRSFQRLIASSLCLFALSHSPLWAQSNAGTVQISNTQTLKMFNLPGSLDEQVMFNSNSPEIVQTPGILLSTLPGSPSSPFLEYAFTGDFGVFSHHIAKDQNLGDRLLYLGLLATNQSDQPVKFTIKTGASYLSQPDALFANLPAYADNPEATLYAGPGDRVATEMLAGKAPMQNLEVEIPPQSTQIIYSLPVPTDVAIPPAINGRSTLMHCHSDGPVFLSHVALFAEKAEGGFIVPSLEDYRLVLDSRQMAGPREKAPPAYNPQDPPPIGGGFRYGRVAGVSQGVHWKGSLWQDTRILERPAVGQKVGYPISAVYLKRLGTSQNQSGAMLKRYPDTAYQAHANYGVHYELKIPLHNTSKEFQTYTFAIDQPANMTGNAKQAEMQYMTPPNKQVLFRGSARMRWVDEFAQQQDELKHLVLRSGQESAPISMITVPPNTNYDLQLDLIYPADVTPPQLLTIGRVE